ncbi:hypothetical protein ACFWUW_26130 [Streptomyces sp. NPDC058655]|uniref:Imm32 family immunity protein n=1 Tax=Streptomyces sp. NPDC058655 TaxID=3346577 RepID=UPI00364697CB
MLQVLCDDETGELEISGSRSDYLDLGSLLRNEQGEFTLHSVDFPFPYSRSLSTIGFSSKPGKISITLSGDGQRLEICGDSGYLDLLAEEFEEFASESDVSDHLHLEYFAGHTFLAAKSKPLVVAFLRDTAR